MHRASDPQQALKSALGGPLWVGVGLRAPHYDELLRRELRADLAEATTENFLGRGGRARSVLERVRAQMPVALHGVSLSIGGIDPLNQSYLAELGRLIESIEPASVSDHLCFSSFGGHYAHDLWPLPYTEEAIEHVARRVTEVQDRIGRRLLLENVSSYVEYRSSQLTEWEFLSAVVERADAGILLDVNNVFVSAHNHGFSAEAYLLGLPRARVEQMHLGGHSARKGFLLDAHASPVSIDVWRLYQRALERFGCVPTIIEWDDDLRTLAELEAEADRARALSSAGAREFGRKPVSA